MKGINTKFKINTEFKYDCMGGKSINEICETLQKLLKNTKQNHVENIKHIINGRATIVILENGSKGIAKCHPNDKFDKDKGFNGESLKRINLQNVWNLHNCIRVRDVEDKRVVFHEIDDGFIQQCFEIITFKELFNLNPPKKLSDFTNEELLEELNNRLK